VTPLTEKQRAFYTKKYLSYLDPDFVHFVFLGNEELVGFYLGMPNLSRAFQKAGGRLFPFGLFHILREFKNTGTVDSLLAGAHPERATRKIFMFLTLSMYDACMKRGIKFAETNHELETNTTVTGIWSKFESRLHRTSRIFRLDLNS